MLKEQKKHQRTRTQYTYKGISIRREKFMHIQGVFKDRLMHIHGVFKDRL